MEFGKTFIMIGIIFIIFGGILLLVGKVPGIGKLPGDILIKKENFTFYFPLTTGILISLVLSALLYLWNHR